VSDAVVRYLTGDALYGVVAFQVVVLLVVLSNAVVIRRPRRDRAAPTPFVSLLVPARNEAANVVTCVRALLAQTYPNLEVLVLDDRSTDDTRAILERERSRDPRLTVLTGAEPPPGWTGKNWACHQLALAARGEVLLFADADTVFFAPDAVHALVAAMQARHADLLSGLPKQLLGTVGEALVVPLFYWAFLLFTPLAVGLVWRQPGFVRAVGQAMAFRRAAYDAVGGHAAVRSSVVEDLDLARRVVRARLACRIMDATALAQSRMYRSGRQAIAGFGRNLFAAFGSAILPYVFVWGWLTFVHVAPVAALALQAAQGGPVAADAALPAASVSLALVTWVTAYARLRLPIWPALLYPLTMLVFLGVALRSLTDGVLGRATWKGRRLPRPPRRWV
jgi:chlorobactene glucosyltransferase